MRLRVASVLLALPLVLLAACGSDTGDTGETGSTASDPTPSESVATSAPAETTSPTTGTSPTESAPTLAACADVWVEGANLPKPYRGCAAEDGSRVKPDTLSCESGQSLIRYEGLWAVAGGVVKPQDADYDDSVASCRG